MLVGSIPVAVTNRGDSNNKCNRVIKTAAAMIVMEIVTIIICTKFVFENQDLIIVRTNPVVRIKKDAISGAVFKVQSPWRHCLQSTSPIVFSL